MSKQKISKKVKNTLRFMSLEQLLILICIIVLSIIVLIYGKFILFFIILFIGAVAVGILYSPKLKGKIGEKKVSNKIKRIAKKHKGYVINDVIIPSNNDSTSQVDHILFLKSGIYVIETKNYAGRIYGRDIDEQWTQVLNYGKVKNHFYSPVKQNNTHIYFVNQLLKTKKCFKNVVIFTNNNIEYIESDYVYSLRTLKEAIDGQDVISNADLLKFYNIIYEFKQNPIATTKEHVKNIKAVQENIKANICPRCGRELALRKSKMGNSFYGCSGYPNCTFTKKND